MEQRTEKKHPCLRDAVEEESEGTCACKVESVECGQRCLGTQVVASKHGNVRSRTRSTIPSCTFHSTSTSHRTIKNGEKVHGTIVIPVDSKRDT